MGTKYNEKYFCAFINTINNIVLDFICYAIKRIIATIENFIQDDKLKNDLYCITNTLLDIKKAQWALDRIDFMLSDYFLNFLDREKYDWDKDYFTTKILLTIYLKYFKDEVEFKKLLEYRGCHFNEEEKQ